jgi:hypothetical protein
MTQLGNVMSEVGDYNNKIEQVIREAFNNRKQKILKKNNVLASLGVPIKKVTGVSPTFSIPTPQIREKVLITRPVVNEP